MLKSISIVWWQVTVHFYMNIIYVNVPAFHSLSQLNLQACGEYVYLGFILVPSNFTTSLILKHSLTYTIQPSTSTFVQLWLS